MLLCGVDALLWHGAVKSYFAGEEALLWEMGCRFMWLCDGVRWCVVRTAGYALVQANVGKGRHNSGVRSNIYIDIYYIYNIIYIYR